MLAAFDSADEKKSENGDEKKSENGDEKKAEHGDEKKSENGDAQLPQPDSTGPNSGGLPGATGQDAATALPAQPADPELCVCVCSKCKLEKPVTGAAESSPHFCCKQCNSKRAQLSKLFGTWPIDEFTEMPGEMQVAFWRSEARGKFELQHALVNELANQHTERNKTSTGGTYLPLSVWGKERLRH